MPKEKYEEFLERLNRLCTGANYVHVFEVMPKEEYDDLNNLLFEDLHDNSFDCDCKEMIIIAKYCFLNKWIEVDGYQVRISKLGRARISSKSSNRENKNTVTLIFMEEKYKTRENQDKFRYDLLNIFNNECFISGNTEIGVLEAAHIVQYFDNGPTDIANGLILRSDLHKLFDDLKILLTLETDSIKVNVHHSIMNQMDYQKFDNLILKTSSYLTEEFLKTRFEDTKTYWDQEK